MSGPWIELLLGIGLCLGLAVLGVARLRKLLVRVGTLDVLALGFPLGARVLTWSLFLLSWVGAGLTPPLVGLVWGLLLALALVSRPLTVGHPRSSQRIDGVNRSLAGLTPTQLAGSLLVLIGLAVFAAWLGVNGSYCAWDDMAIWAVKGYGIAREGSIWAAGRWGDHGLACPLNTPLLIAVFRLVGDTLPASKLTFPLFYLSLAVGCLRFWLQRGVGSRLALLGTLGLASTPLLFEHATLGYANLPYTVYLVLGCAEAVQGLVAQAARRQALSGLLLAMPAWTRPEGALAVASVMGGLALAARWIRPRGIRFLEWVLPTAVLAGVWVIFVQDACPWWADAASAGNRITGIGAR